MNKKNSLFLLFAFCLFAQPALNASEDRTWGEVATDSLCHVKDHFTVYSWATGLTAAAGSLWKNYGPKAPVCLASATAATFAYWKFSALSYKKKTDKLDKRSCNFQINGTLVEVKSFEDAVELVKNRDAARVIKNTYPNLKKDIQNIDTELDKLRWVINLEEKLVDNEDCAFERQSVENILHQARPNFKECRELKDAILDSVNASWNATLNPFGVGSYYIPRFYAPFVYSAATEYCFKLIEKRSCLIEFSRAVDALNDTAVDVHNK